MAKARLSGKVGEIELAIRCLDLTSLEGSETPEEIRELCQKAIRPGGDAPSVAAVVVYPPHVRTAAEALAGSTVKIATVIGFPIPNEPLPKRLAEIQAALDAGADEIDTVLNRDALLSGRADEAAEEIARCKEAAGNALLKVILETGELGSLDRIQDASALAIDAGADFLKSSTGKIGEGATRDAVLVMMEEAIAFRAQWGRYIGIKVSGGVRKVEQAVGYIELARQTLGEDWVRPESFRIGASSLLEELVTRLRADRGA